MSPHLLCVHDSTQHVRTGATHEARGFLDAFLDPRRQTGRVSRMMRDGHLLGHAHVVPGRRCDPSRRQRAQFGDLTQMR